MPIFKNVSVRLISDEESAIDSHVQKVSVFLHTAFKLQMDVVIAPAVDHLSTDALGQLWANVQPTNGKFTFEIATELPFFLPTIKGQNEYIVTVNSADLVVSLRMLRAIVGKGLPTESGASYLLVHRRGLEEAIKRGKYDGVHPLVIKTFVSRKFEATANSAEEAIQQNYYAWRDELVWNIANLLDAVRSVSPKENRHLMTFYTASAYPIFWVAVQGRGCAQFVGELGQAAYRPLSDITDDYLIQKLKSALASDAPPLPTHSQTLSIAQTFCHYGYVGFAIISICIACESVLALEYRTYLTKRGVSKGKLEDNEKELRFSQLLNLHIYAMREVSQLPKNEEVLGTVNWARKVRNDLMHKGQPTEVLTIAKVQKALAAAETLIEFLISTRT